MLCALSVDMQSKLSVIPRYKLGSLHGHQIIIFSISVTISFHFPFLCCSVMVCDLYICLLIIVWNYYKGNAFKCPSIDDVGDVLMVVVAGNKLQSY